MPKNTNAIILSGLPGTGTSTLMDKVAEALGRAKKSAGGGVREKQAASGGLTHEYEVAAAANPAIDYDVDGEMRQWVETHQPCAADWRLGRMFYPSGFLVLLICEENERFRRLAEREGTSVEEAREKHTKRDQNHRERFRATYALDDLYDQSGFDLVIDTTSISVDQELRQLMVAIESENAKQSAKAEA